MIQLAVLGEPNEHLSRWAKGFLCRWQCAPAPSRAGIPEARNAIFRRFLAESELPWLWMLDSDCVPVAATDQLLRCQADIAGAHVVGRSGREAHPHCLSVACLKVSRVAVEKISRPWFRYVRRTRTCECSWFFDRAVRAGFRPVKMGVVGHRFPVTVFPGPEFRFDS